MKEEIKIAKDKFEKLIELLENIKEFMEGYYNVYDDNAFANEIYDCNQILNELYNLNMENSQ